ncbi:hypothetical protein CO614_10990 [Lysobacteraceae bacterium NML120232]|nr:hypothetical protein CO614_10990 [Xanthomonadaceae bacterium NML120232]
MKPRWWRALLLAVLLHILCLWGIFGRTERLDTITENQAMDALQVEIASLPVAPEVKASELPPGPPEEEIQKSHSHNQPTTPIPLASIESETAKLPAALQPEAEPTAEDMAEQEADISHSEASAPPKIHTAQAPRYAAQHTARATGGAAASNWQGQLLAHLERYRHYPKAARRAGEEGVVYISFEVNRKGHVSNIELAQSSGYARLDNAALNAINRANPVPMPPEELPGDPLKVRVPVSFFIHRN